MTKYDVNVINMSDNGTVNVYANGSVNPIMSYTGDILPPSGNANMEKIGLHLYVKLSWGAGGGVSEIIVADEDTRAMSLVTLAPNLAGDLNQWTGAYTAIDDIAFDDADIIYTDTNNNDFQCNLTTLPTGNFLVKATKIAARAVRGTIGIQHVQLGVKTNNTVNVDTNHTLDLTFTTQERLMVQNPVTVNDWTPDEITALQLNLRATT